MLILDVVIINVAVPSIRADLGVPDTRVHLVGITYTLTFGSLLIVCGRLGDLLGRRRMLLAGLALFVLASVLAGISQADWHLFTARALQGVGAAMVSANALATITASLEEGAQRNRALGLWAGVGSAGAIAGQLVGGAVTEFLGWRWIFLVNVPIGVLVIAVLTSVLLRDASRVREPVDVGGALLLTAALAAAMLALTSISEAGSGAPILAGAAVVLFVAFALVERRQQTPVLRFGLLRLPGVRTANLTLFLNAGALGATLFFLTLYLQVVLGYSPLAVGAAFAPVTLVILVLSPHAARLTGRFGVARMLGTGLVLLAAGALLLARMPEGGTYWVDVLPGMLLLALGSAAAYAPTFVAASHGVDAGEQGAASGLINSAQELGAAVVLAVLALVATASVGSHLVGGYRAGVLGAAVLFAVAAVVAWTAPRRLGIIAPGRTP
ncbi:MFS transporter [Actinomycetes bacterium KLBMP 9759]